MPCQKKIDKRYLRMCYINGLEMSKDPSRKVGALIVSKDDSQIALGYNGFTRGIKETKEKWERPLKYEYVIHAEMNAISHCKFDMKKSTLYTTFKPCHRCLSVMINAGVKRVVYYEDPEPFQNQNDDVYKDLIGLIKEKSYPLDDTILKIFEIYGYKKE